MVRLWENTITFAWVVGIGLVIMVAIFIYIAVTKLILKDKLEGSSTDSADPGLEGALGVTLTDLKPAGMALINDERIEVFSSGAFIKKDTHIQVKRIEGSKIIVDEAGNSW